MLDKPHILDGEPQSSRGWLAAYRAIPLYARILAALAAGVVTGWILGADAEPMQWISRIILRFLGALAPALILVAVMDSILSAKMLGSSAAKLAFLLILNTSVAIFIGLAVANLIEPGKHGALQPEKTAEKPPDVAHLGEQLLTNIPHSVLEPLVNNNVIGVVFLAAAFGIAFRKLSGSHDLQIIHQFISLSFKAIVVILHWIIDLVPLAVFCTVAATVGEKGLMPLMQLGWFIATVLIALALQVAWYLVRIRFGCWAKPRDVLRGVRDALLMAFSTASSTATMPVTYAALRDKVGLREDSASMGALVGANFNNDGTALYEAVAALFVAQLMNMPLSLGDQLKVVVMSIIASVGAAGIPEAGLVTMTLVFKAIELPLDFVFLLLPVDWFLDRCRTAINVLGDVNVACMLEGKAKCNSAQQTPPHSASTMIDTGEKVG